MAIEITTLTEAGAHAEALETHRIPAQAVGGPKGFLTVAQLAAYMLAGLAFDPAGSASAAQAAAIASAAASLSAHESAGDPHAQYLTAAEGAAAFDALGAAAAAQAASQPLHANLNTIAGLTSITPLTRLAASGETVTTSSPLLDLAQTWNGAGVTFTGLKFNATDTASDSASKLLDLTVGGSNRFYVGKGGNAYALTSFYSSTGGFDGASATSFLRLGQDTWLLRDAANIFAQRNGVNAQAFRIYNTYTDASNYERLNIGWSANLLTIGTANAGTGVARSIRLDANSYLYLATGGVDRFYLHATAGHILPNIDNTYDLGQASTLRLRTGYFGTQINCGSSSWTGGLLNLGTGIGLPAAGTLGWAATGDPSTTKDLTLRRDAAGTLALYDGVNAQAFRLYNTRTDASNYERLNVYWSGNTAFVEAANAGTGAARNLWVGTTGATSVMLYTAGTGRWQVNSSGHFIAAADNVSDIGANGATRPRSIYVGTDVVLGGVLAATGQVRGATLRIGDGVSAPAAVSGSAILYIDSADGDLKIIFGDGTVKTISVDT